MGNVSCPIRLQTKTEVYMRFGYLGDLESFIDSSKFEYLEPNSLQEACSILARYKEKAKVIAGGTELIPLIQQGKARPECLINLKSIPNLQFVEAYSDFGEEGIKIGSGATLFDLGRSAIINEKAAILAEAINQREFRLNRNRWAYYMATIGGSLFSPERAADIAPALMVLNAKAVRQGIQGWETMSMQDLFTADSEGGVYEILGEIRIPKQQESEVGLAYEKGPATTDGSSIGVAVFLRLDLKHVDVEEIRIVVGGIGNAPIESREGPAIMTGNPIDDHLIIDAADMAAEEVCGASDAETIEKTRELIEEAIRHAIDRSIGDFALGY